MSFPQIRAPKGADLVADRIRERIVSGELRPGTKLPSVAALAEQFQVGLSTVREALSALKATGWLDIRHGSGTYVAAELPREEPPIDPFYLAESFRDLVEARQYIESGCAALAARRRSDDDVAALAAIVERMERALGDEAESEAADIAFHLRIAEASGNALFLSMLQSLTDRLQEHMKGSRQLWLFAERASAEQLLAEHRSMLEAIRAGDEAEASARMMRHIDKVARTLQRLMHES
ncbi:FadR family transcriptional regulator [Paenibacillus sp. TRM 82003]|nr:FadR family transcriptional regulator [Paenibacillus sp. TRM 82003]